MTPPQVNAYQDRFASSGETLISSQNYSYMQQYIYEKSGIVLDSNKQYLLQSRLGPILHELKLDTLDALCHKLRSAAQPQLSQQVVDAMTTNETLFFRDSLMFDALRSRIIPSLFERRRSWRRLRIWSAAASSGQEAYSLAMMLAEMRIDPAEVEILATDISQKMLARAREGRYVEFEISRGLPLVYLAKYFVRDGLDWVIKDEVKTMIRFERFDLRGDKRPLGMFDLILCRNVLIYFDQQTKSSIFDSFSEVLRPGGALLLGSAEVINASPGGFERRQANDTFYYCVREK